MVTNNFKTYSNRNTITLEMSWYNYNQG